MSKPNLLIHPPFKEEVGLVPPFSSYHKQCFTENLFIWVLVYMCKSFLRLRLISTSRIVAISRNIKNFWVYEKKTAKKVGTKGMHNRYIIEENVRMVSKYKKMFNLTDTQEKEKLKASPTYHFKPIMLTGFLNRRAAFEFMCWWKRTMNWHDLCRVMDAVRTHQKRGYPISESLKSHF